MAHVPLGPSAKRGAFTIDEMLGFWSTVVDDEYARPLLERLNAGESLDDDDDVGNENETGLEVHTQAMAQAKRVSQAVERTTEAMFILPWSGQAEPPASGEARATVELTFERDRFLDKAITFPRGQHFFEEVVVEPGQNEGVEVGSGRRYTLLDAITFMPGERGPKTITAIAEFPGYGYNNPQSGSIRSIQQPGAGLSNDEATLIPGIPTHRLQVQSEPDVVVPAHVGQYMRFLSGANAGEVRRVVAYGPADPGVPHGGEAILARTGVFRVSAVSGTFFEGEEVTQATTLAKGNFVALSNGYLVLERTDSTFAATFMVTGTQSGATATIDFVHQSSAMVAETVTAVWEILDWTGDLGFTISNAESPTGGAVAMLDELGAERNIARAPGETDDAYRKRVAQLPDTISPNAIRRAGNRILAPFGAQVCLLEAGEVLGYTGFAADVDAYDYDFDQQPSLKWHIVQSYAESRAFFLVGVPALNLGEFGFAYDSGATNAYDAAPFLAFYDGFPLTAAILYLNIYQDIDKKRAGGVGFDLVIDQSCVT